MKSCFVPAALIAAMAFAPAAMAQDGHAGMDEKMHSEAVGDDLGDGADAQQGQANEVRLVSWDGDFELLKTSRRLRVWRSHLAYQLEVDAEGKATDCKVFNEFRRTYVNEKLCEVLVNHHAFEPAHDASGQPVPSEYTARISYMDLRERVK